MFITGYLLGRVVENVAHDLTCKSWVLGDTVHGYPSIAGRVKDTQKNYRFHFFFFDNILLYFKKKNDNTTKIILDNNCFRKECKW